MMLKCSVGAAKQMRKKDIKGNCLAVFVSAAIFAPRS